MRLPNGLCELRVMKCPRCSEEMKEGYVGVKMRSVLFWSKEEPKSARLSTPEGAMELLRNTSWAPDKKDWLRRAYRCERCGLIIFEEKYTLSSEEKKS